MMYKIKFLSTILVLFIGQFLLQAQLPIHYVPQDATFVMTTNPKLLRSKVDLDQLMNTPFFNTFLQEAAKGASYNYKDQLYKALQNPSANGMDFNTSSCFSGQLNSDGSSFSYVFKLSDTQKFSSFIKGLIADDEELAITQVKDFQMLKIAGTNVLWNNEVAIMASASVEYDYIEYSMEEIEEAEKLNAEAAMAYTNMLTSKSSTIANNNRFLTNQVTNDMHVWLDYEYIQRMSLSDLPSELNQYGMNLVIDNLMDLYNDTYLSAGLNFDKGAINLTYKTFMSDKMKQLFGDAFDAKLNKRFHKYIKGDNLLGYGSMAYSTEKSMEGMKEMLYPIINDFPMFGPTVAAALDIVGIAVDDQALYDLVKGDMAFAVTGLKSYEKEVTSYEYDENFNMTETTSMQTQSFPEFVMMLSGDENNLGKFINLGATTPFVSNKGKYFAIEYSELPTPFYMAVENGIFFFTNDLDLVSNHLDKGYSRKQRISKKHCKAMKKNATAAFMDIAQLIEMLAPSEGSAGSSMDRMVNMSKQTFENMTIVGKKDISDYSKSIMSINLTNKEQNSFEQLFNFFNDIYLMESGGKSM